MATASVWPADQRMQLRIMAGRKQRWRCAYCGQKMKNAARARHPRRITLDHCTPLSRGGSWERQNVVACCARCNERKGAMTADEFRALKIPLDSQRLNVLRSP